MKNIFLLVILCALAFTAMAQKDTTTIYMTASGQVTATKNESAFFIKIAPSDSISDPKLYKVAAFYKDGRRLFKASSLSSTLPLKLQGAYTMFFGNGNPMSVRNFKDGEMTGTSILYYPNGKFYNKISTEVSPTDTTVSYEECRDSTGNILTQNGNGNWITFNQNFSRIVVQGHIKNYKPDSVWLFNPGKANAYTKTFKDGKEITTEFENKIFTAVEEQPEFPGGMEAFYIFLAKNLLYPAIARENNIQGRIIMQFVVERDGSLSDIHVVRGIGSGCDEEAVRVMRLSPRWKPGMQSGRPVRVEYSVPISFTLENDGKTGRTGG